jgi:DNA replication protein DnaC
MTTAPLSSTSLPLAFKALRLPTMARCWLDLVSEAATGSWSHERLLTALCDQELNERTGRRLATRLAASKLPPGKRLDSFDFSLVPSVRRSHIEALLGGDWLRAAGNILAFGGTGSGKSHCAAAIGYGLIDAGYSVFFTRTTDLVQRLQAARRDFTLPVLLAKLDLLDVVILDDIGYARKDPAETSVLFELIAERYERKSLIITCDRPFAEWDTIFPDKTMTVAAIDRLVHHATILEFGAESYRLREAGKKAKSTSKASSHSA